MILHSKYTDYKIIYKDKYKYIENLEHITNANRTIIINYYESGQIQDEWWFLNRLYHREDGPAIIYYYESGKIKECEFRLNNNRHREDGPAIITYYKSGLIQREIWLLNSEWHREDGPAKLWYDESGNIINQQFYLNNIEYTYNDFIQTPEGQVYLKQQSVNIFD